MFGAADFAEYEPEWVSPLTTTYRGWDVFEIPPNSQGRSCRVCIRHYGRPTASLR